MVPIPDGLDYAARLLVVGFTTGSIPQLPVNLNLLKGYSLVGVYWGRFVERQPADNAANFVEMARMLNAGQISPHIAGRFTLEETLIAWASPEFVEMSAILPFLVSLGSNSLFLVALQQFEV